MKFEAYFIITEDICWLFLHDVVKSIRLNLSIHIISACPCVWCPISFRTCVHDSSTKSSIETADWFFCLTITCPGNVGASIATVRLHALTQLSQCPSACRQLSFQIYASILWLKCENINDQRLAFLICFVYWGLGAKQFNSIILYNKLQ